ncbi:HDOD domain-containing protein, partial [bacterium]|nr:HDOD domain-containing protein [bacterium]
MSNFMEMVNFHLEQTKGFGVLPFDIKRINGEALKDHKDLSALISIIEEDKYITSKILEIINHPYFNETGEKISLLDGFQTIGFEIIRNLVLFIKIFEFIRSHDENIINKRQFLKHGVGVGLTANILSKYAGKKCKANLPKYVYFLGGLWHDIGRLVFEFCLKEEYKKIKDDGYVRFASLNQLEKERISIDHTEAGALLAEKWEVNSLYVDVILGHHNPFLGSKDIVVIILIHIANYLCNYQSIGTSGELAPPVFYDKAWGMVDLS